ncbi:MAG: GH36-type glycosyl hydrolase domain-containing protein, partial [Gemmatimonadales bacterium]
HRVAFAAAHGPPSFPCQSTGDRLAFLGRWGSPAVPAAVITPGPLESRFGPGLDPAAACHFAGTLASGASAEWIFLLGEADRRDEADALIERFRAPEAVEVAFGEVRRFWRDLLAAVQVETPSPALDVMVNGWLPYQTLACRLWARSALYQSGGAFGFRDQLQDAAALIYHRPDLTRRQILLHAEHQFVEGDVLHWWHPPRGKGIRTRCSDDSLWLPWAALSYLETTGDLALLGEPARYLAGPPLQEGEAEAPRAPADSGTAGDIYDHCCRAIDRSLPARGRHGLPLMGTGDWNDGMNRVGRLGKGESVWLGLFLLDILPRMIPLCEARGDADRASRYRAVRRDLEKAVNDTGWDGAWYRRAYYDDGTALGSSTSIEARIDALAQAWAVLSGAAPAERVEQALDALERYLVDESAGIIRLLDPPFDYTTSDPGYIKGYLPGVRENGGQYTHAALWVVRALFEAGKSERASVLLEMINPVRHGDSPTAMAEYRVEPYVAAADVYGMAPHLGRGGWTWYTGSAGWMFRVAFESLLGIRLEAGGILVVRPGIPKAWPGFTVRFRLPDRNPPCEIAVQRDNATSVEGAAGWRVDDGAVRIPLAGVGAQRIEVRIGPDVGPSYRPRLSP